MSVKQDLLGMLRFRAVQWLALTALVVGVGTECFLTKLSVLDLDVWWHLSVGDWILQHHAFPHSGIFSRTAAARPWMAYSWGYEVLLARSYDWFGFVGIALFGTLLTIAVALTLFWMLHRLSGRFWVAWTLTIAALSAFLFNIMPRPVFFTMLLYAVTLTLILNALRTGRVQFLYWLPLVFALWANLHIQFVYGLIALGLLAGINLLQNLATRMNWYPEFFLPPVLPVARLFVVLAACLAATCVGPYSYHLYGLLFSYSSSKVFYSMITELQALSFEGISHFLELLLGAAAFFVIGWQKKIDPFKLTLLSIANVFAFRTTRDAWFLCITAAGVIAVSLSGKDQEDNLDPLSSRSPSVARKEESASPSATSTSSPITLLESAGVAIAAALLLVLVARNTDFNSHGLDELVSKEFPVDAVNFIRRNPVGGPLYNSFDWGGFLIFYMPQYPVSIDGRGDLYGDSFCGEIYATEAANVSPAEDPYLNEAGLVILKNTVPLARLLPTDKRFRVIYHDQIATVLARN